MFRTTLSVAHKVVLQRRSMAAGCGTSPPTPLPVGLTVRKDGVIQLAVSVKPGSKLEGIFGGKEGVELRTSKPPREGEANADVCIQVAAFVGVAKSKVSIVAGGKSKQKVVGISGGTTVEDVAAKISALAP